MSRGRANERRLTRAFLPNASESTPVRRVSRQMAEAGQRKGSRGLEKWVNGVMVEELVD